MALVIFNLGRSKFLIDIFSSSPDPTHTNTLIEPICYNCIYCENCYLRIPAPELMNVRWISKSDHSGNLTQRTSVTVAFQRYCEWNKCVSCGICQRSILRLEDFLWDPRPQALMYQERNMNLQRIRSHLGMRPRF